VLTPELVAKIESIQRAVEQEITRGFLQNEKTRLDDAAKNVDFFNGDFDRYPVRAPGSAYDTQRLARHTRFMNRVVHVLTANLYKDGPARNLPEHAEASQWLEAVYRDNAVDALLQDADRYAAVGDVCALQVQGTEDPDRPIDIQLWDAHEFCVWLDPDNPRRPLAVATIDRWDNKTRLRLWTALECVTYTTEKLLPGQTAAGRAFQEVGRELNTYDVLPFAFVHWEFPSRYFWTPGPGSNLRDANDYINFFLTEHGDSIRYMLRPVLLGHGVAPGWRPPSPIHPGDFWDIPADADAGDNGPEPRVEHLQPDVSFVEAGWYDLQAYIDHSLEMAGVPPGTIRMKLDAQSGVALVAEQIPLILWAQGRRRPFGYYEADLAKVVLQVGAQHLGNNGLASAAALAKAALDPGLVLRWPEMFPELPGPERDTSDGWQLENRLASRTRLLMKRHNFTREEAEAYLEEIAEDLKRERELFAEIDQAAVQDAMQAVGKAPPDEDDPETDPLENENEEDQDTTPDEESE
jgi:hypothetical protein